VFAGAARRRRVPALPGQTAAPLVVHDPARRRAGGADLRAAMRATRDALRERIESWIEAGFPGLSRGA
jgi:hypothetical protein